MSRSARTAAAPIVAALVIAALAAGSTARADEATARRLKLGRNLVIGGEVLFGVGYAFSVGTSFAIGFSCGAEAGEPLCRQSRFLWGALPLAGPWVQVGYDHDFSSSVALFAVPAVVQLAGVGLVVAGIVVHHRAVTAGGR